MMRALDPSDTLAVRVKSSASSIAGMGLVMLLALACAAPAGHAWADRDDDEEMNQRDGREFDEDDFEERDREDVEEFDEGFEERYEEEMLERELFIMELEVFERLMSIVQRSAEVSMSPQMSAIAAVMAVDDHVEEIEEVVEFLEPLLEESDDSAVKRAIRSKLVDAYRDLDQPRKAKAHMRALILMQD